MESIAEVAWTAKTMLTTAKFISEDPDGSFMVSEEKPEKMEIGFWVAYGGKFTYLLNGDGIKFDGKSYSISDVLGVDVIELVLEKAKKMVDLSEYRYLAQDSDGFWCVYKHEPEFDYLFDSWMPAMTCLSYKQIIRTALFPNHKKNLFHI